MDQVQYGLVAALACFALSTISLLFFAAAVEFKTSWIHGTLTLVGPGVLWLVAFAIFVKMIPPGMVLSNPDVQKLNALIEESRESSEWRTFGEWKVSIGEPLRKLFEGEAEANTLNLLNGAFITRTDAKKLKHPTVETIFVYPHGRSGGDRKRILYKFQRFSGTVVDSAYVYLTAKPTLAGGRVDKAFYRWDGSDAPVAAPVNEWFEVFPDGAFEGMLVARYEEDMLPGDWLQTHTPKYVSPDDAATVVIAVLAPVGARLDRTTLWEMRGSARPAVGAVPLSFRPILAPDSYSEISKEFRTWFAALAMLGNDEMMRRFVEDMGMGDRCWADILDANKFSIHGFRRSNQRYPLIVTFDWVTGARGGETSASGAQAPRSPSAPHARTRPPVPVRNTSQ